MAAMEAAKLVAASVSPGERAVISSRTPIEGLAAAVGPSFQTDLAAALDEVDRGGGRFAWQSVVSALSVRGISVADALHPDLGVQQDFWCDFEDQVAVYWERAAQQTPWTPAQLTPTALEWCIRKGLGVSGGGRVLAINATPLGAGHGMMSALLRVTISWDHHGIAKGLPSRVVIKFTPTEKPIRSRLRASQMVFSEQLFYTKIASSTRVTAPNVYFLDFRAPSERMTMVMEDLVADRGCAQIDQLRGITVDEADALVQFAGQLHGQFWNSVARSGLEGIRKMHEQDSKRIAYNIKKFPEAFVQFKAALANWDTLGLTAPPTANFVRCIELYAHNVSAFYQFFESTSNDSTVVHGDFRADNIMVARDQTGSLAACVPIDYQCLKLAPGEFDLAYLLSQSLTITDRRKHEAKLLKQYFELLPNTHSVPRGLFYFQLFLVYGIARIVLITMSSSNMFATDRGRQLFATMLARANAAIDDWNALAAWEQMLNRVATGHCEPPTETEIQFLVPVRLFHAIVDVGRTSAGGVWRQDLRPVLAICDIDGTLLGNDGGTERFNAAWHTLPPGSTLCYNTSRSFDSFVRLVTQGVGQRLLHPAWLVCNGGTAIYHLQPGVPLLKLLPVAEYAEDIRAGSSFDLPTVRRITVETSAATFGRLPAPPPPVDSVTRSSRSVLIKMGTFVVESQMDRGHGLRYSVLIKTADTHADAARFIVALQSALAKAGIDVHIDQSWVQLRVGAHENRASGSSVDDMCTIDIVPASAGKGAATTWLRRRLGFSEQQTIVAGDGANDIPMLWGAGYERGVIVGNAEDRLVAEYFRRPKREHYYASSFAADGVLEGLRFHFGESGAAKL